jgi:hypothetical protein
VHATTGRELRAPREQNSYFLSKAVWPRSEKAQEFTFRSKA